MSLVESLKRMEAILDKMDSTINSLERTFAKKVGDTIIEERIRQRDFLEKRIEAKISALQKELEEMKKK